MKYKINILSEIKESQINAYKTMPLIRYIYGRQFNLLYNNSDENNKNKIVQLLKYITNNSEIKMIDKYDIKKEGDLIQNNIQDWNKYIQKVLDKNKLTLEKIYNNTIITQKNLKSNKGIFIYTCEKPEKNIFQIYKYLTGNSPMAQNVLFCNKITSNEEITSFLYRAILCEFNSCFILAGLESLETEKKTVILDLLNNLFLRGKEEVKMNSFRTQKF